MSNIYILSWDMYGLEACINVTELETNRIINILSDKNNAWQGSSANRTLNALILRAKFNSQRHYEIYAIEVDDNVNNDEIVEMFKNSPNTMAELCRSRGHKIYSDRRSPEEKNGIVIT